MTAITAEQIREILRQVPGPDGQGDIVSREMVSDIFVSNGGVAFSITVPSERAQELEPMRQAAEKAVSAVPGVERVMVALTAERKPGEKPAGPPPGGPQRGSQGGPQGGPQRGPQGGPQGGPGRQPGGPGGPKPGVPGIGKIIAVASGKGGVGKSTTAVNLALGLKALGLKVGVLDADIYGPSLPRLLGIKGRPEQTKDQMIRPMTGHGLTVMSMGFLVEEDTPMIWRGPMVISALTQMLREVQWGELDVLVVDMPPGTGDAQLTMAQQVPLAGAVIVSTPQDLALIDARKGLNMFRRVEVPVLGIVENMSYFLCPSCGERSDIFGHGGARTEAEKLGVAFLGEVPLHMDIRSNSDAGTPVVASEPNGPHAKIYTDIAAKVWEQVEGPGGGGREAPSIVIEE